jgi:hypothetical protein
MSPPLSGGELKMNSNGTLHKVNNLWIASASMNQYPNLLGSLLQSQLTLAALGFGEFKMANADFAEEQAEQHVEETPAQAEL